MTINNETLTKILKVIFFIAGVILISTSISNMNKANDSAAWSQVTAEIIKSEVMTSTSTSSSSNNRTYSPVIEYQYEFNSRSYQSDTVYFGLMGTNDSSFAHGIRSKYPKGMMTTAYVNPADPEEAVLEPGKSGSSGLLLWIGILLIPLSLFGIDLINAFTKKYPRKQ